VRADEARPAGDQKIHGQTLTIKGQSVEHQEICSLIMHPSKMQPAHQTVQICAWSVRFQLSLRCFFIVQFSGLAFVEPFCALTMAAGKLFSASVYFASNRLCGFLARGRK
jgi:hypothetical protein